MNVLKIRANSFIMAAAATIALGGAFLTPGFAKAANTDGPWPEPPSCSNETGTCTSIEDTLAYECFFEESDFPITWCDNPLEELSQGTKGFVAEAPTPDPAPARLAIPSARR